MEESKRITHNYQPSGCGPKSCTSCILKVMVPYWWCDTVGEQVKPHMVCDSWKGAE